MPSRRRSADQPGSTTVVELGSTMSAGPAHRLARHERRAVEQRHLAPAAEPGLHAARCGGRSCVARHRVAAIARDHGLDAQRRNLRRRRRRRQSRSGARTPRGTPTARRAATRGRSRAPSPCLARAVRARSGSALHRVMRPVRPSQPRDRAAIAANAASSPACVASSSGRSRLWRRIRRRSARPMPQAERTPASGWTRISAMPSASATRQACCGAAPP